MTELSEKSFGLVIAFIVPGFTVMAGMSLVSPNVATWMYSAQAAPPSVAGFLFSTLASMSVGLTISAIRWAFVDRIHHATGVEPPEFDFARLDARLQGFAAVVDNHYRFYQFYANMFIALVIFFGSWVFATGSLVETRVAALVCFLLLEAILFAASRDTLKKYYARAAVVLGPSSPLS